MRFLRSFLAAVLILAGSLLTFPATLAVWEQRVLLDEDSFVALAFDILDQEAVQSLLASRVADKAEGLAAEEGAEIDRQEIETAALKVVSDLPNSELGDTTFRTVHKLLTRLLREESIELDTLVLDVKPLVEKVNAELNFQLDVQQLEALQGHEIVLVREEDLPESFRVARRLDAAATYIALLPLLPFALALLVAPNRRRTLVFIGVALVFVAALRLVLLEVVVDSLLTEAAILDPTAKEAAIGIYDSLAWTYERYDVYLLAAGAILIVAGFVLGRLRRSGPAAP